MLEQLVHAGFDVIVLSREAGKVPVQFAERVKEVVVDYSSIESLQSALVGVDAVVSTLGAPAVGEPQRRLIDAAIAAGVDRFIPSDFGCDHQNPLTRTLPVFAEKVKTEDYLINKCQSSSLTYTFIYNNLFLDWGLTSGFLVNLEDKKISLFNGGDIPLSFTRLGTVGDGVVGVLRNPVDTMNRSVRIEDGKLSFKQLYSMVQEAIPGPWTVSVVNTDTLKSESDVALGKSIFDEWVWLNYVLQGGTNEKYGPNFQHIDNKLLGLRHFSPAELKPLVESIVKHAG